MCLVAINTVEIYPVAGQSSALRTRLDGLLETLRRTSGCAAYSLTCDTSRKDVWIVTGHWCSAERMEAHFTMPCLSGFFELAADRLASGLQFGTFLVSSFSCSRGAVETAT
jgi:quinol monooxygenase YgiN